MNTKFLYCKYDNLKKLIHNGASIRFTDINKFIKIENEKIRDDESKKTVIYTPPHGVLEVDGIKIDFVDLRLSHPTRRAHVLCLSNYGNNEDLFNHFKSDTCIEINVDLLIKIIKDKFKSIDECAEQNSYYPVGENPTWGKVSHHLRTEPQHPSTGNRLL